MARYVFDIEANGFLDTVTKVHCLWLKDLDTGERFDFAGDRIEDGLRMLMAADLIVGHNVIKYDIPVLTKIYPWFRVEQDRVFDTIIGSRLIWTNLVDTDMAAIRTGKTTLPGNKIGWHSLEAWGHRLGLLKGDYAEEAAAKVIEAWGFDPKKDADAIADFVWGSWNEEMHSYCGQDVEVTEAFYRLIVRKNFSQQALDLEMQLAWIIAKMERNGFGFDSQKAEALLYRLQALRAELGDSLRSIFEPWEVKNGKPFVPKRDNAKLGYKAGVAVQKYKMNVFNPNSNDQIADRFMKLYGWKPDEMTPSGKPKVDETILESLPYPEAKELARYKMIQKRIGQIGEGDEAWLKYAKPDGRVYTTTNQLGTVSGRASHSKFNIGQVPSNEIEFGPECRECFGPRTKGRKQLGCDVSGLELRMLGHFMYPLDGGEYANEVVNGDVHTKNQKAAGLATRAIAKTWFYAFIYGSGVLGLGQKAGGDAKLGARLKKKLLRGLPALKKLIEGVQGKVKRTRTLKGLDGRILHSRSPHSALNLLLQSAGAVVCKQWIIEFDRLLTEHGLHDKVAIMAWVHDELQMEIDPDLDESFDTVDEKGETKRVHKSIVGELCVKAIANAGTALGIRVPLTGEYKIGNNWKDCH